MRKDPGLVYRVFLMLGDAMAIIFSFGFAYYFRTHIDTRPYYFTSAIYDFILAHVVLIPVWIIILVILGLYSKSVLKSRAREYGRLLFASIIGIMTIITYDFFVNGTIAEDSLFPVRTVVIYAALFCFLSLVLTRTVIGLVRRFILQHNRGLLKTVIVGNDENTRQLLEAIRPESGHKVVGVVARQEFVPEEWRKKKFATLKVALAKLKPDAIIHTDGTDIEGVNQMAIDNHALYYYAPNEQSLVSHIGNVELIASTPVILVRTTPLMGGAKVFKRVCDILLGLVAFILALPFMLVIYIVQKISEPRAPALYKDTRLSRFNKKFALLKFRTIKMEYNGLSPEDAFAKMGKPKLAVKYRANGDYLKSDPRYTALGRLLRKTSLDELPQIFNILKGDISFVGPRALVPSELKTYGNRGLLLSVKSGLTGLAQVSGRRDISFDERRALDIYYIQNWSPWMDMQILFKTVVCVIKGQGAR
jgi:exopolysaccharide biosynthesis polyprenyl glycosylphosphotransferase